MNIDTSLRDEIRSEFEELKNIEVGTEKYKIAVDGITKLVDRAIEIEKIDVEYQEKVESRDMEHELKLKQIKDENRDRLVKNCLTGVSVVGGIGLTVWGALKSWEFEKEGTVTSAMGKMFINAFRPKR